MAKLPLPCPHVLRQLIDYDPVTGVMIWRHRTPADFQDGGHTAAHNCAVWNAKNAGAIANRINHGRGYKVVTIFNRKFLAHRVAWAIHYGSWPTQEIDHINGERSDNAIANLRDVSRTVNVRNIHKAKQSKSGVIGVRKRGNVWQASIVGRHLGNFTSLEAATEARAKAEVELGYSTPRSRAAAQLCASTA